MPKIGLLPRIIIAIILGLLLGTVMPAGAIKVFITFNAIFSQFLGFTIPLIIVALIVPGIADLGTKGRFLLLVTVLLAYASTLFSGFSTYFITNYLFDNMISYSPEVVQIINAEAGALPPYFVLEIDPILGVMPALVLAFILGLGIPACNATTINSFFKEFSDIVSSVISNIIIPALPIYIFGIFLNMMHSGAAFHIIKTFGEIILVIFALHIILLLILYVIAGIISKRNPIRMLINMLPAYMTALGTSSSAATIPVTLIQTEKNGVNKDIAEFCIPLCATIHLPGSIMKIVATSVAICIMTGIDHSISVFFGFILMLSVLMIAAPGVPGGAIMVAVAVLQTMLGFNADSTGLMIALYIAIDSFGTACNVTGDCSIAVIVDAINSKREAIAKA